MLVIGSILVAAGALAVGLLALLFRHPRAPRWTEPELVAMLATIPVTAALGLGLVYLLAGCYRLLQGAGDLYELGAPLMAAIAVAAIYRVSGLRGRLEAYDNIRADADQGISWAPPPPPKPEGSPGAPGPSRPPVRKAA